MQEGWWPADTIQVFHMAPGENYLPTPALNGCPSAWISFRFWRLFLLQIQGSYGLEGQGEKYQNLGRSGKVG